MSVFDELASGYNLGMLPLEWAVLRRLRRQVFPQVKGKVLELGIGTGVNLPLYGPGAEVVAFDRSSQMLSWAAHRRSQAAVRLLQSDVHQLPFPSNHFDAVTGSLLFCSVAKPAQALLDVKRVLRPGGRLLLMEHTRGEGLGARLTDILHPLWCAISHECHLNRETARAVEAAGFRQVQVEMGRLGIFRIIEAEKENPVAQ